MELTQHSRPAASTAPISAREAKYRLIEPDFISRSECADLIALLEQHGKIGDGYQGNPHPHTATEIFGGYSLDGRSSARPDLPPGHMTALRIMMKTRNRLKKHFRLPFLWLDYGHLVFRKKLDEITIAEDDDFSHPWHLDNQSEGVKHRTHTAILYLNDEFTGGLTRFKETDFGPFREIKPEPGKLASFDVAKNAHAVSKLTSGNRYVLNMWFSTHWQIYKHHRRIFKPL